MFDPVDLIRQPQAALLRLLVAGLLGGLIGIERERSQAAERFAGVRTFPLFSLLGATLALVSGEVGLAVVVGFAAVAVLAAASYVRTSKAGDVGSTTETAALATYWIGVAAGAGALLLAGALGIGVVVLLASKERVEAFSRALTREELEAALTLAVIAAIILPILPDARYGPWGVWNPRQLWGLVVIVSGLSFVAFVAMRIWGNRRGLYISGLLGGLVSSTAATVSFAARSRQDPGQSLHLAVAAGLASLVMYIRIGILAVVAGSVVFRFLGPFLGAALVGGTLATALMARRGAAAQDSAPRVTNPFRLGEAIRFAIFFGCVLLAVEAASRYLGAWGLFAAAVLAGLTDVDAITLALAGRAATGLDPSTAATAIALAALANTVSKVGYATWFGERGYRRAMLVLLGAAFVAGGGVLLMGRML